MPSTKYVRVTCWCASASAAQSASWNSLSPYWMLGPGPTWATEVKGLLLALKTSVVWYLKTVPLVPPPRTRDSELLLAGHHVSYGILVGTLKSRGRLVYFVIPLLLFLWRFPSSSILDLPNRRAIWWLHSHRTDRKPVGDLRVTRRGDRSACHPDLGGVGRSVSGLSQTPARSCQGAVTATPACSWCGERHWQWSGSDSGARSLSAYQAQAHGRLMGPAAEAPQLPCCTRCGHWVSSPHLATILGTLSSDTELELLSLFCLPSLALFLSHQGPNHLPVPPTCSHRSLWCYLHLSLDR